MLQRSLAAGAALLLSDRFAVPARAAAGRVIVIGAGFSGLAAAHELSRAGYEVTIAEALKQGLTGLKNVKLRVVHRDIANE